MKHHIFVNLPAGLLLLLPSVVTSYPVPTLDPSALVHDSNAVVVGRILAVMDAGPSSVRAGDRDVLAREIESDTPGKAGGLMSGAASKAVAPVTSVGANA